MAQTDPYLAPKHEKHQLQQKDGHSDRRSNVHSITIDKDARVTKHNIP